jgi:hypothetical protein
MCLLVVLYKWSNCFADKRMSDLTVDSGLQLRMRKPSATSSSMGQSKA